MISKAIRIFRGDRDGSYRECRSFVSLPSLGRDQGVKEGRGEAHYICRFFCI